MNIICSPTELPIQIPADKDQVSEAPKCVLEVTIHPGISRTKYFLPFGFLEVRIFMLLDGKFVLFWGGEGVHFLLPMYTKVHIVNTFK